MKTTQQKEFDKLVEQEKIIQCLTFGKFEDTTYKSWSELKADGWKFEYQDNDYSLCMSRYGYFNFFRIRLIEDNEHHFKED